MNELRDRAPEPGSPVRLSTLRPGQGGVVIEVAGSRQTDGYGCGGCGAAGRRTAGHGGGGHGAAGHRGAGHRGAGHGGAGCGAAGRRAASAGAAERLLALGLAPGRRVRVLRNDGVGPVILAAGATRLALGRGLARGIRLWPDEN